VDGDAQVAQAPAFLTESPVPAFGERWRDPDCPLDERVDDLVARMSLPEKVGQLYGGWVGVPSTGEEMAPHQHELTDDVDWKELIRYGLGHLTRPFGTAPVEPALGVKALARMQAEIAAGSRFGIPAIAHEECLTGFMTWRATVYPTPLAWGATFDAEAVETMGAQIGTGMRRVGVHQGLAPVLDVARDPRWGRTEETIGEDPYLIATLGTAYVRGLESAGVVATIKHFVAYSGSRAGRNLAPVGLGPRELADVYLPPFEMAVRDGGARSVMHSYVDIDGVPAAADEALLTALLRREWGFEGTVVSDYFGVSFLEVLHRVAATPAEAAALALCAGIDIELPGQRCFGEPLVAAVQDGAVPESLVDRATRRVLRQKFELGLLDPDWTAVPPGGDADQIDLDPPEARDLARRLAEESVVLLANDGTLPLRADARVALVGPLGDDVAAMLGCYTFPRHVALHHPDLAIGVDVPTLRAALLAERDGIEHVTGCTVDGTDTSGIAAAAEAAGRADVCVVAVGDRAGLFGQGTSGEGCDAEDLSLPGVQDQLIDAVLATGTPVVLVVLSGRPYALGAYADRLAAGVQAFFPGQEGGRAVAGVLTGRVCPSGRLPIGVPRRPGGQPATYLSAPLGHRSEVSTIDPTALYPFGHGLSYTTFAWDEPRVDGRDVGEAVEIGTDGRVTVSVSIRNTGARDGTEVVQLYLHDPVAQVTRPVMRLIGYARVPVSAGAARRVAFDVPADLAAFAGRRGRRVVEAGDLELRLAASSVDVRHTVGVRVVGEERFVGHDRALVATPTLDP
jgi:beta-xylosidase